MFYFYPVFPPQTFPAPVLLPPLQTYDVTMDNYCTQPHFKEISTNPLNVPHWKHIQMKNNNFEAMYIWLLNRVSDRKLLFGILDRPYRNMYVAVNRYMS